MKTLFACLGISLSVGWVGATAAPQDVEMPMAEYLALLGQIAPAAQDGAIAYTLAYERKCKTPLSSTQLRRAISDGSGDPLLWQMMRAAHARDSTTLAQLGPQIQCGRP
jgi:hypothetical protein